MPPQTSWIEEESPWTLGDPCGDATQRQFAEMCVWGERKSETFDGTQHGRKGLWLTPRKSRLVRDAGGAVAVEYTMILIFVALPVAAALAAAGVIMLDEYRLARDLILLPVP